MQDCSSTWYFILNIVEGLSNSAENRPLRYMIDHEIIYEIRDGRFKRYHLEIETIFKLMKNYHPTLWHKWNQRIIGMYLIMILRYVTTQRWLGSSINHT